MTTEERAEETTHQEERELAWGVRSKHEARWPASLAVLAALILYVTLPDRFTLPYPWFWLVAGLEVALLMALTITRPHRHPQESPPVRLLALVLIGIINLANLISLVELLQVLVTRGKLSAASLLASSAQIWITNVLVFALWYWELDRGGPGQRRKPRHREPDFLFPQMTTPHCAPETWTPNFLDYVYVAFTNATAFSPTDTMPLTSWAKSLMMVQSFASLITVALVAARAVNILA